MPAKMSVATLDAPEFINISSVSPLISKCEIKVLYVGANRNRSYISKEVALEMAQTLPGVPIVGHFVENKEDFGDHGQQVIIDDEGIKFNTLTTPYGFVAPDAKVWFQKFEETDEFGNVEVREYLMTEGYLWTEQFKECKRVIENGNPQSMELDENSLKGYWSTDYNKGIEFFIINDAIFSKLCILGEDVEPCFEGANVTAPEVSSQFSTNKDFHRTLFSMMKELNDVLKGEPKMENENIVSEEVEISTNFENSQDNVVTENEAEIETIVESTSETVEESLETPTADFVAEETVETVADSVEAPAAEPVVETEFKSADDKEKEAKEEKSEEKADDSKSEETPVEKKEEDSKEDDDEKKKYSLLENEYNELKAQFSSLEAKYNELVSFKADIEDQKKTELINSFSMLSEEEKKDVVDNKAKYSFDEIESKLSVLFTRKQMNAAEVAEAAVEETVEEAPLTYTVQEDLSIVPDWVKAVVEAEKSL